MSLHAVIKAAAGSRRSGTATGVLSGSGTLSIFPGATSIVLTGRGGTGGTDTYYDPGQPYIAGPDVRTGWQGTVTFDYQGFNPSNDWHYVTSAGSGTGPTPADRTEDPNMNGSTIYSSGTRTYEYSDVYSPTTAQEYIAPSTTYDTYYGESTTASVNGSTATFAGGYGGAATTSQKTLTSNGAGQNMTYSIPSGGQLSYYYTY